MKLRITPGWQSWESLPTGGSVTKTLAQWGVSACVVHQVNGGDDSMEITMANSGITAADLWEQFSTAELFTDDDVRVFVGVLTEPGLSAGDRQTKTYRISGPLAFLKSRVFEQAWRFAAGGSTTTSTSSNSILNQGMSVDGLYKLSTKQQLTEALEFAQASGLPIDYDLSLMPADVKPPENEATDRFISDVIADQCRWTPSVVRHWDYTGVLPVLKFQQFTPSADSLEAKAVYDIDSADLAGELRHRARVDLLVKKVTVLWLTEATSGSVQVIERTSDVSETDLNDSFAEVTLTMQLRGKSTSPSGINVPAEEGPFLGLAARLHEPFKRLQHDIGFKLKGIRWDETPGLRVNILNGPPALTTAKAPIQRISRDVFNDETSYQCGPMNALGLGDLYALKRVNTLRSASRHSTDRLTAESTGAGGGAGGGDSGMGTEDTVTVPSGELQPYNNFVVSDKNITLTPGTIGNLLVGSAGSPVTLTAGTGTGIIEARLTHTSEGAPSSVSVSLKSGSFPTDNDDTHKHVTIGTYDATGDRVVVAPAVSGSLAFSFSKCEIWFTDPQEYTISYAFTAI